MDPVVLACFAIIVVHNVAAVSSRTDPTLLFGLMPGDRYNENRGALSGIEAALDEIDERNDLLPGYKLNYDLVHSQVSYIYYITSK